MKPLSLFALVLVAAPHIMARPDRSRRRCRGADPLWRTADGALVQILKMPEDAMYVGFSPDGRWLAASADDGTVTLWRLRTGAD